MKKILKNLLKIYEKIMKNFRKKYENLFLQKMYK